MTRIFFKAELDKKIFYVMAFLMITLLVSYIVTLKKTVGNIVAREKIEKMSIGIENDIHLIESNYLALKRNVSLENARELGMSDPKNVVYVSKKPLGLVVKSSEL